MTTLSGAMLSIINRNLESGKLLILRYNLQIHIMRNPTRMKKNVVNVRLRLDNWISTPLDLVIFPKLIGRIMNIEVEQI